MNGVYGPQVGRYGIGHLIPVRFCRRNAIGKDACVAMRINQAGSHHLSLGVKDLRPRWNGADVPADSHDASTVNQDGPLWDGPMRHGHHFAVYDGNHLCLLSPFPLESVAQTTYLTCIPGSSRRSLFA
jgi:hypothetical protein